VFVKPLSKTLNRAWTENSSGLPVALENALAVLSVTKRDASARLTDTTDSTVTALSQPSLSLSPPSSPVAFLDPEGPVCDLPPLYDERGLFPVTSHPSAVGHLGDGTPPVSDAQLHSFVVPSAEALSHSWYDDADCPF
jgi:hypothetical protein